MGRFTTAFPVVVFFNRTTTNSFTIIQATDLYMLAKQKVYRFGMGVRIQDGIPKKRRDNGISCFHALQGVQLQDSKVYTYRIAGKTLIMQNLLSEYRLR